MSARTRPGTPAVCDCGLMHTHGTRRMYDVHGCGCILCRVHNAARAQAWRNDRTQPDGGRKVDPTGSRRRLEALAAAGVSRSVVGAALGITPGHVSQLRRKHAPIRVDIAARITRVYEALWDYPTPCEITRGQAQRWGYSPPMSWDDDEIDDPDAMPYAPFDEDEATELRPCGSIAAYQRHRRSGEQPCPTCFEADRRYRRERRAVA